MTNKLPPHNEDAERAVLGSILLNNQSLYLIQDGLAAEDFYVARHRVIYSAMIALASNGSAVDHVTLGSELIRRDDLAKIGGSEALDNLTDKVVTVANVEYYAKIVKESASVRRMINAAQQVASDGFGEINPREYLDVAERAIFEAARHQQAHTCATLSETLGSTLDSLEKSSKQKSEITGLSTGFSDLDRITAGFQSSDLIIIAGRPAMGKTALALNVALNACKASEKPVLMFSLEMSKDQLTRRLLAYEAMVNATKLKSPNRLTTEDWRGLTDAASMLHSLPLHIDDASVLTPLDIRARARRIAAKSGLGLIIIDYLQLMRATVGGRRKESREQEVAEISRSLKALAKELDVPVVALSQLNRGLENRQDKRPMMSDLRESGSLEQDTDLILFVYRDEVYHSDTKDDGLAEIIVGKQRSGPTGTVKLVFRGEYTRFDNWDSDDNDDGGNVQVDDQSKINY